jgi:hypothetical protein
VPTVTDALYVLRASVRSVTCDLCECDVDHNGVITVLDALRDVQVIVGLPVELACAAGEATTTTTTSTSSVPATTAPAAP